METTNRFWSCKFFRLTLLDGDPEAITNLLRSLEKQRNDLESEIATVTFYMQGGINYFDAYQLSMKQLSDLISTINDHYERQANSLSDGRKTRSI